MAGDGNRRTDRIVRVTLETGRMATTLRSGVADDSIRIMEPMVREALRTGKPFRIGPLEYWFSAREDGGCLTANIGTEEVSFGALASMTVRPPPDDGEPARLEVSIRGLLAGMTGCPEIFNAETVANIAPVLDDFERHIAWTWLAMKGHAAAGLLRNARAL